ncbi:MAG: carbonic anhydrase [Hyphomicrobiales bacterium]|nr:MAG: carbonic anhydrase [Hyphomicrobiales bacterium]
MLEHLLKHNQAWANARREEDPSYFKHLSELQSPEFLWIGCSDSRVPANVITGLKPGEVFVHRNVANLVHSGDLNLLSVLEYAVEFLNVRHIIVCGHYGCGGVHAAMDGKRHGVIDHWLQPIRDVAGANHEELSSIADDNTRHERLCELSIEAQVERLKHTPILESAIQDGKAIEIHGWVYGLNDGLLRDLKCSCGNPHHKHDHDHAPNQDHKK